MKERTRTDINKLSESCALFTPHIPSRWTGITPDRNQDLDTKCPHDFGVKGLIIHTSAEVE